MESAARIDISAVRKLYASSAAARATLDYFAGRTNSTAKTTLNRLLVALQGDGHDVDRSDVRQVLKGLASAGCGTFVVGRKGHPSRFLWTVSLIDVGRAASGEGEKIESLKASEISRQPGAEDDGLLEHRYRLRPDIELRLDLPANLTSIEANRLAEFIRTLPFV